LVYPNARPNKAHYFFSKLEQAGKLVATVTQNIDNFHQESGSKIVYELHGSVHRNYCLKCGKFFDLDYILKSEDIPYCDVCRGLIKPDVVLYEESLNYDVLNKSINAIASCDSLIIVGTSLVVYPAAGLINYFTGKNLVLINKQKTNYDSIADLVINEDIIEVVQRLEGIL
jgi:NAD-dependent deacetylase